MNRLRLIRFLSAGIGAVAGAVLVATLWSTSPLAAIAAAVAMVALGAWMTASEFTFRSEARHRATLRKALRTQASRISDVEQEAHPQASATDFAAYRERAVLLHRLARVERAVGMRPGRSTSSSAHGQGGHR